MKLSNDLGKDNILGLVLKLAIPAMFAQLINLLYSIVDRMYIGNIPDIGSLALAGVGVCGPIVTLLSSFGTLIGLGGSIIMSIKMGEENYKKARQVLANSFFMLGVLGVSLTIIFLLIKSKLIMLFGGSEITFQYANTYLTIYTLGSFFAIMALGLNYFIICQGFPLIAMGTVAIGAITNIVLDTVFVYYLKWGVAGAAWATVISQILSFIFAFKFLIGKKIPISIGFGNYSKELMKQIVKLGISPFFILATDSLILISLNSMLQRYGGSEGDIYISTATIVQSYLLLITGPLVGLSGGTQALLGYNYGARKIDRVKLAVRYIIVFALILTSTMTFATSFIAPTFLNLFTQDTELINISLWAIKISILGMIPLSFQYCFVDAFTGLGWVRISFSLSMWRKFLYISCTVLLPIFFGARYAFYAQPISDIIGAVTCCIIFYKVFNTLLNRRMEEI